MHLPGSSYPSKLNTLLPSPNCMSPFRANPKSPPRKGPAQSHLLQEASQPALAHCGRLPILSFVTGSGDWSHVADFSPLSLSLFCNHGVYRCVPHGALTWAGHTPGT